MDNRLERSCLLASFVLPLGVYFYTAAPGPFWEDSAIFSTAAATLGIPHSPGFPLWVLFGKLFSWLIPHNPARATNLMCGFFGAGATALFYLCAQKVLTRLSGSFSKEENQGRIYSAPTITLTALGSALVFAFSQTVWLQAVRTEVYSLQLILTLSTVLIALSLDEAERPTKFFLLAAFLWGLSLAVHPLLSVSALPGLLILGCFKSQNWKKEISKWAGLLTLIGLAWGIYFCLPLRSAFDPYINWNQPDNWERFWAVVTRKSDWALSVSGTASNLSYLQFLRLTAFLMAEYTFVFWFFVLAGILALAHCLPRVGLGVFILLLSNFGVTLWAAPFSAWNLDLLGYLTFGIGTAVLAATAGAFAGALWLSKRFSSSPLRIRWVLPAVAGVMVLFVGLKNKAKANLHNSNWPQKLGEEILRTLPHHSVLVCASDRILTPLWYAQGALKMRPDVTILLNDVFIRPILAEQTKRRNPDLPIDPKKLYPFTLSGTQTGFKNFVEECRRPVFSQVGDHITEWKNFSPAGYVLRYQRNTVRTEVAQRVLNFATGTFLGKPDLLSRDVLGMELFNWGVYLSKLGFVEADSLLDKAAQYDGENPRLWTDLGKAYMYTRRFELAETCFKLALSGDPYQGDNYLFLAFVLRRQGKAEEADAILAEGRPFTPDKIILRGWKDEKTNR